MAEDNQKIKQIKSLEEVQRMYPGDQAFLDQRNFGYATANSYQEQGAIMNKTYQISDIKLNRLQAPISGNESDLHETTPNGPAYSAKIELIDTYGNTFSGTYDQFSRKAKE